MDSALSPGTLFVVGGLAASLSPCQAAGNGKSLKPGNASSPARSPHANIADGGPETHPGSQI